MKKTRKSSKKGFTLVELIVVLVILAILAAMLVPALTGYIKRARQEKDYQMAATVLTAAQSAATYQYSLSKNNNGSYGAGNIGPSGTITGSTNCGNNTTVLELIGDASGKVSDIRFTSADGIISGGSVKINGYYYSWTASSATWTASATAPTT